MPPRNEIAEQVRALLAERALEPGDRLPPERELAARLGVSRSRLREGLRRLTDLGILEARQGSGTYLAELDVADLLGVRLLLEPHVAGLAAQRRTPADAAQLAALLDELERTLDDAEAFAAVDLRMHAAIADASHSLPSRVMLDAVADLLRHSRTATASDAALRGRALVQMRTLVHAIDARDVSAAETAMRRHLTQVGSALQRPE